MSSESGRTIILLDDEERDLESLRGDVGTRFPDHWLLAFSSAKDLYDSLSELDFEEVDLVIADGILGPLERGWDVHALLKRTWPHVKRVLISNKVTIRDMEYAINLCTPDGFIYKTEGLSVANTEMLEALLISDRVVAPVSTGRVLRLLDDLSAIEAGSREKSHIV